MSQLDIVIPARMEMFLARTIDDILANSEGDTEVIAICDGNWPDPPIKDHPKVHLIYHSKPVGQRAATNEGVKFSRAKFIMKVDAHCAFDKGFDVKLMSICEKDWTVLPRQYNLHAFDWVCKCGERIYQGPTPKNCPKCGNTMSREMVWKPRNNTRADSMMFDKDLHFQYWKEYSRRPESNGDIVDTMSILGACWMMHRERFWELGGMDEDHGSWGQMGTELACKTWLSGGRLAVYKKTWYAHMFRTQGGDFGFPYPNPGIERARSHSKSIWLNDAWPKAKYPLSWLINKFAPVPTWDTEEKIQLQSSPDAPQPSAQATPDTSKLTKGLCYYTDNRCDPVIMQAVQNQLLRCCNGHPLVSVSLEPMKFGGNIFMDLKRGPLTMAKQQLAGLEALDTDIVFMVEHDVLYPPEHFDFIPPRKDIFYYNLNWWKVRASDGQALHFKAKQVSGLCAYRDLLLEYFRKRVRMMESGEIGGRRHFEPGGRNYDGLNHYKFETWESKRPYVDIRHESCLSRNIFDPSGYRSPVTDWQMRDEVPGWGKTKNRFNEFLSEVTGESIPKTRPCPFA